MFSFSLSNDDIISTSSGRTSSFSSSSANPFSSILGVELKNKKEEGRESRAAGGMKK
jgi:hypothetical protein